MAFELPDLALPARCIAALHVAGDARVSPRQASQGLCGQRQQAGRGSGHGPAVARGDRQEVLRQESRTLQQCRPAFQSPPLLEVDEEGRRRQQAAGQAADGGRQRSRRLRQVQDRFHRGRNDAIRFGLGVAFGEGRQARHLEDPNGENPLVHGGTPILGVDVWEHSYYIDYRNARPKYLEAFVDNLINWDYVLELYEKA